MVLGPDILLHLRLLRLERSSRTVQDIRLTNSLSLRRLLLVGEILKDLQGPAAFLASEASDFVNGHILYVDGGILAYIGKQP